MDFFCKFNTRRGTIIRQAIVTINIRIMAPLASGVNLNFVADAGCFRVIDRKSTLIDQIRPSCARSDSTGRRSPPIGRRIWVILWPGSRRHLSRARGHPEVWDNIGNHPRHITNSAQVVTRCVSRKGTRGSSKTNLTEAHRRRTPRAVCSVGLEQNYQFVGGRWSMVSDSVWSVWSVWSVVSGRWSVVQWLSVVSGRWVVVSGQWSVVQWLSVVSGRWSVVGGSVIQCGQCGQWSVVSQWSVVMLLCEVLFMRTSVSLMTVTSIEEFYNLSLLFFYCHLFVNMSSWIQLYVMFSPAA